MSRNGILCYILAQWVFAHRLHTNFLYISFVVRKLCRCDGLPPLSYMGNLTLPFQVWISVIPGPIGLQIDAIDVEWSGLSLSYPFMAPWTPTDFIEYVGPSLDLYGVITCVWTSPSITCPTSIPRTSNCYSLIHWSSSYRLHMDTWYLICGWMDHSLWTLCWP